MYPPTTLYSWRGLAEETQQLLDRNEYKNKDKIKRINKQKVVTTVVETEHLVVMETITVDRAKSIPPQHYIHGEV